MFSKWLSNNTHVLTLHVSLSWCLCLAYAVKFFSQLSLLNVCHILPVILPLAFSLYPIALSAGGAKDRKRRAEGATHRVWWAGWRWLWGPQSASWWHPHWDGISFHWAKCSLRVNVLTLKIYIRGYDITLHACVFAFTLFASVKGITFIMFWKNMYKQIGNSNARVLLL